jgi:hypothetical protein
MEWDGMIRIFTNQFGFLSAHAVRPEDLLTFRVVISKTELKYANISSRDMVAIKLKQMTSKVDKDKYMSLGSLIENTKLGVVFTCYFIDRYGDRPVSLPLPNKKALKKMKLIA